MLQVMENVFCAGCKHLGVMCDVCKDDITGMRWKCMKCLDIDLCTHCYNEGKHSLDHGFYRIVYPDGSRYGNLAPSNYTYKLY